MTAGTFSGHAAPVQFRTAHELVKNADENWPTALTAFSEVIAATPPGNRDDSRISATE
ncbi:hypothetical protein [Streptomyces sp. UG1]|uniref:hypothetical protein n=1 Tax=Streptomyces sp. UG1 TaxID=3417652 RepID=UPI003CE892BE